MESLNVRGDRHHLRLQAMQTKAVIIVDLVFFAVIIVVLVFFAVIIVVRVFFGRGVVGPQVLEG